MAYRVPVPGGRELHRMRLVHAHVPDFMVVGIENRHLVGLLKHLHPDIIKNERHPPGQHWLFGVG
jgi:hypothetical protein